MISLHKLHLHVYYEDVYQYKRFQKFSTKTLTRIAYPNFKNKQKIVFSPLKVKDEQFPRDAIIEIVSLFTSKSIYLIS